MGQKERIGVFLKKPPQQKQILEKTKIRGLGMHLNPSEFFFENGVLRNSGVRTGDSFII